jgi:hypothetical protein
MLGIQPTGSVFVQIIHLLLPSYTPLPLAFHIVIVMGIVDISGPVHLLFDLGEDPISS